MKPEVETLSGLERRVELSVSLADVEKDVEARLKRLSRTAKMPGFRPGKVPFSMLSRQYGPEARMEAINAKVGLSFQDAIQKAELRVAGMPSVEPKEGAPEGTLQFFATFEIYPEFSVSGLDEAEVTRFECQVGDAEVEKTLDILRQQRVTFEEREGRAAADNDQVILDFVGKIDGVAFDGGTANDFPFVLGQGRMLPEFEEATRGLKAGETKTFPLSFPESYGSADVAGKTAEFTITVKQVKEGVLPELNSEFAKQLGEADGDMAKLRQDIQDNLAREVKGRVQVRTKNSVMDALLKSTEFDVPKALVSDDVERRIVAARADLKARGMKDADKMPIPPEAFQEESERRVRLGLIVAELVRAEKLQIKQEQLRAKIEEFSLSYENPAEVMSYYLSDQERLAEVEAVVLEDNVVDFVLAKAKTTEVALSFDELMGNA